MSSSFSPQSSSRDRVLEGVDAVDGRSEKSGWEAPGDDGPEEGREDGSLTPYSIRAQFDLRSEDDREYEVGFCSRKEVEEDERRRGPPK